jgi:biotin transport system substrate-specific component
MSATTQTVTLYQIIRPSSRWLELPILLGFNVLLAACAQIAIDLPFVPITGQTFGVLLVAMALGRVRGTAVVMAYIVEGACGLPVFAHGRAGVAVLMGPTGGYLIGFLAAALVTGWLADKGWDKRYVTSVSAMALGTLAVFACGVAWLSWFVPTGSLMSVGVTPFIPGAIIKITLAAAILPSIWKFIRPGGE